MDLRHIVSQILKEDAPIGGTQPQPQSAVKFYDVLADYQNFERTIDKQTEAAKKTLEETLKKNLNKKKVVARASKGTVGQAEQEYQIDVVDVKIVFMSDEYYIALRGADGKEYYINTAFKIKVMGDSTPSDKTKEQPAPGEEPKKSAPSNLGSGGANAAGPRMTTGMVQPQSMGVVGGGPTNFAQK